MTQRSATPVLLMIDTATPVCSLAVSHGQEILAHELETERRGEHAAIAAPIAERLLGVLRTRGLRPDAIALSSGPGSYTGLRIGSSLAKGLCQGLEIPLIAVSTLELMARGYLANRSESGEARPRKLCPMIDARRMEVYTATFDATGLRLSPDEPRILSADEPFSTDMAEVEYHFFGSGSAKCTSLWSQNYIVEAGFVPEARYMLEPALEAYRRAEFVDLAYWTPNYLKDYIATVGQNKVLRQNAV